MSGFIQKIQNADRNTKKRWVIIMSGISMVVVFIVWLYYITSLFGSATETVSQPDTGFLETMQKGLSATISSIKQDFDSTMKKIGSNRSVIINK